MAFDCILTGYCRLMASLGNEMSDAFGRIANFQEEVQLRVWFITPDARTRLTLYYLQNGMDSQYDRHGIHRMRALARRLQDLTNRPAQGGVTSNRAVHYSLIPELQDNQARHLLTSFISLIRSAPFSSPVPL